MNFLSFDPNRVDFEPYGLMCENWQATLMPRPDHHIEVELNLLRSGYVTYLLGGQKVTVEAGKLSLFWGAVPHQIIDFDHGEPYLMATIPLQHFLQWRLPEDFVQALMRGQLLSDVQTEDASLDIAQFDRWRADLQCPTKDSEHAVLLEMQARLTRLALNISSRDFEPAFSGVSDAGLSKVEQMACYIARHYTQKLSIKVVADAVKLNPNYAMSLFQKSFGTTLVQYLTQHRLSHAQRMLTTTNNSITDVALQSGFQSISRFNDVFHQTFNCSPRDYRKLHS